MKRKILFSSMITNEKGNMAALLSVIVLSIVIVTSLSSVYVYLENRAKFQGKLKQSYQISYVMDELARITSLGYDLAYPNGPVNADGSINAPAACPASYTQVTQAASPQDIFLCIPNANYIRGNICVGNETFGAGSKICLSQVVNIDTDTMIAEQKSYLEKWYERLDAFFDTTVIKGTPQAQKIAWNFLETEFKPPTYFGWLLPNQALASEEWLDYHNKGERTAVNEAGNKVVEDASHGIVEDENFLNINPDYVNNQLTGGVGAAPELGGGGLIPNQNPGRPITSKFGIAIKTATCSSGNLASDIPELNCFRCEGGDAANPAIASNSCFRLYIRDPSLSTVVSSAASCAEDSKNCYQMSVRLIR